MFFLREEMMKKSSVSGRGLGTTPLPCEGMEEILKVIFSLCADHHGDKPKGHM